MRGALLSNRVHVFLVFLVVAWILSRTFELRKTSWSCRSLGACLGFGSHHRYAYARPDFRDINAGETILRDGTLHYQRTTVGTEPSILILALNEDGNSWSSDFRETKRTAFDFMKVLASTELDLANVSIAILTASPGEYLHLRQATDTLPFARVDIYHHAESKPEGFTYETRHDPAMQLKRRSAIASLRNYLMSRALRDEKHILWLDADVVELSPKIVQTMLSHAEKDPAAGIITARCQQNRIVNYDKNAWKLDNPELMDVVPNPERDAAYQKFVDTRKFIPDLIKDTSDTQLVPLDSVGGSILYIEARLVRQGANFPTSRIVGTTWGHAGWVGLETEGLCYTAKALKGGGCFVLGGKHFVRHSDWA